MEDYILINGVERIGHLRSLVRQDLRDIGVKMPKSKKLKKLDQSSRTASRDDLGSSVFGEHLCDLPSEFLKDHGYVPLFLIEAAKVIKAHIDCEGVFRKSGSVSRQKELRQAIDNGNPLDGANIHDVAVLVKQFFRDLPDPLFSSLYHEAFLKCYQLPVEKEPVQALLQLCLCLPVENIGALRFILHLLDDVASHAEKNKMNASNLALVLAPNFMHSNKGTQKMSSSEEKHLQMEASIVEILIKNCKFVGLVNGNLQKQVGLMAECFGTDDELDVSDDNTLDDSKRAVPKKKRRRSGSLTGLVNSIASGFAKLRRSTDGRNMNMSSSSTFPGELSIASTSSMVPEQSLEALAATPCVMRKRRASGDTVPFSASKKKAILSNLPQRSALASTPFTPASTVKRSVFDESQYIDDTSQLNATTPCQGAKGSRKKLNLFTSPGSNKKVKSSLVKIASPGLKDTKGKGKNFFRRLSGSRHEKEEDNSLFSSQRVRGRPGSADGASPRGASSDLSLPEFSGGSIQRSASSPSMHEADHVFTEPLDNSVASNVCSNSGFDDLERISRRPLKAIAKSDISSPRPLSVPVVANAKDGVSLRRSRREEFEMENSMKKKGEKFFAPTQFNDLDKSVCSQLDVSLMGAVLPPPKGFGDQTLLEEQIDVDGISNQDPLPSQSNGYSLKAAKDSTSTSTSSSITSMVIELCSGSESGSGQHLDNMSVQSDETFIDVGGVEDMYVTLRPKKPHVQEGDYVVLRKNYSVNRGEAQKPSQGGIDLLRENYQSEEDSSSSVSESLSYQTDSDLEELKSISSKPDLRRKKSLSAQDLQSSPKFSLPVRSQSQYISPCKKFNYKPHLEISKETHRILTNAGYLRAGDSAATGKDVQVPVKSPKRSAYREEMIQSLRYSFHERHNRTNRSVLGKSCVSNISMDSFNSCLNSLDQSSLQDSRIHGDRSVLSSEGTNEQKGSEDNTSVNQKGSSDKEVGQVEQNSLICGAVETVEGQRECVIGGNVNTEASEEQDKGNGEPLVGKERSTLSENMSEQHIPLLHEKSGPKLGLTPKISSFKDCDRSLTLSGFLDKEIKRGVPPVKIKRAEMKFPCHESVSNLKALQAGMVAENVKQFSESQVGKKSSQARKMTFPESKKRGTSPIRIPTIFAKSDESFKHYQEITQAMRERTGNVSGIQGSSSATGSSKTLSPEVGNSSESNLALKGDSLSESNTTVMDASLLEEVCNYGKGVTSGSTESNKTSTTLMNNCRALKTDKSSGDMELMKSPLQESTNTAATSSDSIKLYTSIGLTPKRLLLRNDASALPRSNPRPHIKRLKGQRSPRRRACKSPGAHAQPLASAGEVDALRAEKKLVSVAISFEDKGPGTSGDS